MIFLTSVDIAANDSSSPLLAVGDTWGRVRLYSSPASQPRTLGHTYTGHSSQVQGHYSDLRDIPEYCF